VLIDECLVLRRAFGDPRALGHSLLNLACHVESEDRASAAALYEESIGLLEGVGDRHSAADARQRLARIVGLEGDLGTARELLEESLAVFRESGARVMVAWCLCHLAGVAEAEGDHATARSVLKESLRARLEVGSKDETAAYLEMAAEFSAAEGDARGSARLFGAAEALREELGTPVPPPDRAEYERAVAAARAALGDEAFAAAWAEGRAMSWQQAIAYALGEEDAPEVPTG
jgi:tetratricopeptide (TPR) repeat protein